MEKLINGVLFVVLIVTTILFGIYSTTGKMLTSASVIVAVLFFINIDKFEIFRFFGLEAKLKKAVDQAYVALEDLKQLGLCLSAPIIDEMAVSGNMFIFLSLKHKLQRVKNITTLLQKLGASKEEIQEKCSLLYARVIEDHNKNRNYSRRHCEGAGFIATEAIHFKNYKNGLPRPAKDAGLSKTRTVTG